MVDVFFLMFAFMYFASIFAGLSLSIKYNMLMVFLLPLFGGIS